MPRGSAPQALRAHNERKHRSAAVHACRMVQGGSPDIRTRFRRYAVVVSTPEHDGTARQREFAPHSLAPNPSAEPGLAQLHATLQRIAERRSLRSLLIVVADQRDGEIVVARVIAGPDTPTGLADDVAQELRGLLVLGAAAGAVVEILREAPTPALRMLESVESLDDEGVAPPGTAEPAVEV